jgi:hypothetical protein
MYRYFFSYHHGGGFGSCTLDSSIEEITDFEKHISPIAKSIAEKYGFEKVIILYFNRLS